MAEPVQSYVMAADYRVSPHVTFERLGDEVLVADLPLGVVHRISGPAAEGFVAVDNDMPKQTIPLGVVEALLAIDVIEPVASGAISRRKALAMGAGAAGFGIATLVLPAAAAAASPAPPTTVSPPPDSFIAVTQTRQVPSNTPLPSVNMAWFGGAEAPGPVSYSYVVRLEGAVVSSGNASGASQAPVPGWATGQSVSVELTSPLYPGYVYSTVLAWGP